MAPAISNACFGFGHVRFEISRSLLAIGRNPHSAAYAWLGRNVNKKRVRISRQSAMRMPGQPPALCGANAVIARTPAGADCAAGQIHAHSRITVGPVGTLLIDQKRHPGVKHETPGHTLPFQQGPRKRKPAGGPPPTRHKNAAAGSTKGHRLGPTQPTISPAPS